MDNKVNKKIEICKKCGREVKIFELNGDKVWHKIIDGTCCFCLFEQTKTKEKLGINIKPDGTAFEIINRLIEKINIQRDELYWFISNNQTSKMYLSMDMNYWHQDCMDDSPKLSPEKMLQRMILFREMDDLDKLWSENENLILRKKYEDYLNKKKQ